MGGQRGGEVIKVSTGVCKRGLHACEGCC
jgi:hypothetical protein